MKLHKALHPSFMKRMHHMRFIGKFVEGEQKKEPDTFLFSVFPQCLLYWNHYLKGNQFCFKGYVTIKKRENFCGYEEKKVRKTISLVSTLL